METSTTATASEPLSTTSVPTTSGTEPAPSSTSGTTSVASTQAPAAESSGSIGEMDAGQWLGVIALGAVPIIGPLLQILEISDPGSITGNEGSSQTSTPTSTETASPPPVADATTPSVEASSVATSTVDASASVPAVSGMTDQGQAFMDAA